MGPIFALVIGSCAVCLIFKLVFALRVKVLEEELKKSGYDLWQAWKERNAALEQAELEL